jgi:cob(I)alamin adenosyltransferase
MSISTMKGDKGITEIINGKQISKNHPLMECLGTIDELIAFLGDAKTVQICNKKSEHGIFQIIEKIQNELFNISGIIAGNMAPAPDADTLSILVNEIESKFPQIHYNGFIVPGVNSESAKLHIARTVCRRAERRLLDMGCPESVSACNYSCLLAWFNRLSDLLFLMAEVKAKYTDV